MKNKNKIFENLKESFNNTLVGSKGNFKIMKNSYHHLDKKTFPSAAWQKRFYTDFQSRGSGS